MVASATVQPRTRSSPVSRVQAAGPVQPSSAEAQQQLMDSAMQLLSFKELGESRYHPMTTEVLGNALGADPGQCNLVLQWFQHRTHEDVTGASEVLKLLRRSYELLASLDRRVFIDVALSLPAGIREIEDVAEWLHWLYKAEGRPDTSIHEQVCALMTREIEFN